MKKKNKKKVKKVLSSRDINTRLSPEVLAQLRRDSFHSTKKGEKGYNRKKDNKIEEE